MKRYDRAYFDRWYRDPKTRVKSAGDLARKARLAVSAAEYLLGRPVRSALDVGCGEGEWRAALRRVRPGLRYVGVDASAYVVRSFGESRGIVRGSVGTLRALELDGPFDLVVCCDVLHYVADDELARGVPALASLTGGAAYVELFTSADDFEGDLSGWRRRTPAYYRRLFERAGLEACGLNCYAGPKLRGTVSAMELAE
ncbi:MAG TPA: class I SAM-dependent methyltransferase [Gemmatimonadaceae bacterium]|nr:class I SAM-dependent methyltransferase [Gemmatimonadaceae bacterium]